MSNKVQLNGFSGEVLPLTIRTRMTLRAIYTRLTEFTSDYVKELDEDADAIEGAMAGYASLCSRTGKVKGDAGFRIVSSKDDATTMKAGFDSYLYSEHYDIISALENAMLRTDTPLTPPEQHPDAEPTDPN